MTASEHIIVAPRQQAGHDHAEEHGIIPQPFHQHACQKAAQRNTEIEGHKKCGTRSSPPFGSYGVHRHGLQGRLDSPETIPQQDCRQQVARHVVRKYQQQYACHDSCVTGINQPRLPIPVNGTPQQNTCPDRGQSDEDEIDPASGQMTGGSINRYIDFYHAIRHHEEELRNGSGH